ncbi:SRPBCC family protein [Aquihabitans daechungensis]|uniref:SRPBCC family protein n=1 Tax=Aquihabitans daechungensis TaxID=1052257 RepID=UPI003BA260FD
MSTATHTFELPIGDVFDGLADPWTYPEWLVGAKEMRSVDAEWPAAGSSFHHRVGLVGPLTLADSSSSCEVDAPNLLVLEVRLVPPDGHGSRSA